MGQRKSNFESSEPSWKPKPWRRLPARHCWLAMDWSGDAGQREPARRIETARGNHGVMAGMEAIKEMDPLAGVGLCIFLAGAIEQVPVMGGFFQTCRRWRLRNPH